MLQTSRITSCIGKQRCVHRHPIQRRLKSICYNASLPEQFADIDTCISISVHNKPTGLAFVGSVISCNLIQSSASATELRSISWINFMKTNDVLFTKNRQSVEEFGIRNLVDFPVAFFSFAITKLPSSSQFIEVFNNNRGISIRFAQFNNLMSNLPTSRLDKVSFFILQSSQGFESFLASQVSKTFELVFSSFKIPFSNGKVLSKVKLPQNFLLFSIINGNSKAVGICIYTNNILAFRGLFKFLFDKNLNSKVFEKQNRTDDITLFKIILKSLVSTIFSNRQGNSFIFSVSSKADNQSSAFICINPKELGIKSDRNRIDFITNLSSIPNRSSCRNEQVSRKFIFLSKTFVSKMMQGSLSYAFILFPNSKKLFRTSKIFFIQFRKFSSLSNCRFKDVERNYLLHCNNKYNNQNFINVSEDAIPPLNKLGGLLA